MQDRDTHMLDGATAHLVMPFERAATGHWFCSHYNYTLGERLPSLLDLPSVVSITGGPKARAARS